MNLTKNHLALLTTGRQDWGILRTLAHRLRKDPAVRLSVLAGGMACDDCFGNLADRLIQEGFSPTCVPWDIRLEDGADKSREAAAALSGFGAVFTSLRPDAVILVGDRLETLAAATAAVIHRIPVVHLHGGEETEGALDNYFRHAISKLSTIHFVSHSKHRERLLRMGENPAMVQVVGAPGIDNLQRDDLPSLEEVLSSLGLPTSPPRPLILVTYHPPTAVGDPRREIDGLLSVLDGVSGTLVLTLPNDDPGNACIRQAMECFAAARSARCVAVNALGEDRYWTLLKGVDAVVGNSSSGIIEAPAVPVPVLNLGRRQQGRETAPCVLTIIEPEHKTIAAAMAKCLDPAFRKQLTAADAPYGHGHSSEKIHEILKGIDWHHLPPKRFCE